MLNIWNEWTISNLVERQTLGTCAAVICAVITAHARNNQRALRVACLALRYARKFAPLDAGADAWLEARTRRDLDVLDAHLARQPFMAGERFTMADIPVGCEIHRWWGLPQDRAAHPHLERWYNTVSTRPGARGVLDQPLA